MGVNAFLTEKSMEGLGSSEREGAPQRLLGDTQGEWLPALVFAETPATSHVGLERLGSQLQLGVDKARPLRMSTHDTDLVSILSQQRWANQLAM